MSRDLAIRRLTARVYRSPLQQPVTTSFGVMRDRPMLLVEAEDGDGTRGWGEVWCNFPAVGAEHRARLIDSVLSPLLVAQPFASPADAFRHLTRKTAVLALQSGEPGPFAQAIAGVDIALWDLVARRAGTPLWRVLQDGGSPSVRVYASGLNPDAPEILAAQKQREGFTAFKLKVGFGTDRDLANLGTLRDTLGDAARLMIDANQGWDLDAALNMLPRLEPFRLDWLEEPLRADRPWEDWRTLQSHTPIALAAGENLAGEAAFAAALEAGALGVVQPDLAKWGGFTGCLPVARRILAAGVRFCPHYLGGGIGLLASAHLLAAAGSGGMLEIDANPNPLRTCLLGPLHDITEGRATLAATPGLGLEPDLGPLSAFLVRH
ncbi:MAG: mandelate racemase/muconate lactonizing enzyme family protein [Hyphomonadaceae bacterium]|nr:mandelate racemase/muconate lactonizing enzyme family protein [Hyphomonadaceae bacterium]